MSVWPCFFWTSKLLLDFFIYFILLIEWIVTVFPYPHPRSLWLQLWLILFNYIPNEHLSVESLLAFLTISLTNIWINPKHDKHDLSEQAAYPCTPTSMVNWWTYQPAPLLVPHNRPFSWTPFLIFSLVGHVNSISITSVNDTLKAYH